MPHIVVEYAEPLAKEYDLNELCRAVCEAAISTEVFPVADDIKVRAIPATHWYRPGKEQMFAHAMVRLLSGRTTEQKATVTNAILRAIEHAMPKLKTITVDINDIDRET